MKKKILILLSLALILALCACTQSDADFGSVSFYSEAAKEDTAPVAAEMLHLTEEQAVMLQNMIGRHNSNLSGAPDIDRSACNFDGCFELGGGAPKYYFTYKHNGFFYDQSFVKLTAEEMQYLRSLQTKAIDAA